MIFVLDASVFVASARTSEIHHTDSLDLLQAIQEQAAIVFCPTLVLSECAAALARQTNLPSLPEKLLAYIEDYPQLSLIPLDVFMARRAAQMAIHHRLRGADAVYAAVAEAFNATLITWDQEMLARCPAAVPTLTPAIWIEQQTT
jgi:predicted nucleic acid-binding protein